MKYFVYFSASGNGDLIADYLKDKGYQPVKVEMVKPIKKVGFFTMLKYGFRAGGSKKEKIKELNLDLKSEDEVIIGSPIWNDRLSTPINAVLDQIQFDRENTRFILYPAGEGTNKSLVQLEKLGFKQKPIIYANPKKNQDKMQEILGL